ncbi:hypothetical protein SESBI_19623 [Sesbania bispinosa]|nr:hypothetical protein SESBI_19623 [Sesbania bispinosa]
MLELGCWARELGEGSGSEGCREKKWGEGNSGYGAMRVLDEYGSGGRCWVGVEVMQGSDDSGVGAKQQQQIMESVGRRRESKGFQAEMVEGVKWSER